MKEIIKITFAKDPCTSNYIALKSLKEQLFVSFCSVLFNHLLIYKLHFTLIWLRLSSLS